MKFLVILLMALFLSAAGCKSGERVSKEVRQAEKAELQMQKEADKEYQKQVREHYKIQSKQSKQLMKEMKRQGRSTNRSKKRSFWDRLFNNDCK
jgi:flagellar biosynthesis component FlhA